MLNEANIDHAVRLIDRKKVLQAISGHVGNVVIGMGREPDLGEFVILDADERVEIIGRMVKEIDGRLLEMGVQPSSSGGET